MISPHSRTKLVANVWLAACLLGCPQQDDAAVAAEQDLPRATPQFLGQISGEQQAPIESAYAAALGQAKASWLDAVSAQAGYAENLEGVELQVARAQALISHAVVHFRLTAQVTGPNKQVRIRDAERVATTTVEAVARTRAEAAGELQAACAAYMRATAHSPGEDLDAILIGESQAVTEGRSPYRVERVTQGCTGFATTVASCRQPGGHPRPTCTYEDGPSVAVEHSVACEYQAGQWQCNDADSGQRLAAPVAEAVSSKLNELLAPSERVPAEHR